MLKVTERPSLTRVYKTITIATIVVEQVFQRPLNKDHVKHLTNTFDPELFGTVVVCDLGAEAPSILNGSYLYSMLDGQHREDVARSLGYTELPAEVLSPRPIGERARVYTQLNSNKKKLRKTDIHKGNLASGDPTAIAVEALLEEGRMVGATTKAVGLLTDWYNKNDRTTKTVWNLELILSQGQPIHLNLMRGLHYLETHLAPDEGGEPRSILDKDIKKALVRHGQAHLAIEANKAGALADAKGSAPNWARGIVNYLNEQDHLKLRLLEK